MSRGMCSSSVRTMSSAHRPGQSAFLLTACCLAVVGTIAQALIPSESYHEEVAFKPIGKGLVLSQFVFQLSSTKSSDHVLFPWGLHQLQRSVPFTQLNLAMTKGRWDHRAWGEPPPTVATPMGLELSASFPAHLGLSAARHLWGNLTEALSGMVCASVANQVSPTLLHPQLHQAVDPSQAFREHITRGPVNTTSQHWFHLLLPQEGMCTENLSPLLRLLPCKGVAGPAALLPLPILHAAHFYSLQVLTSGPQLGHSSQTAPARHLTIMVNIVHAAAFTPDGPGAPPGAGRLHLSSLFPVEKFPGSCVLASTSSVYIILPSYLAQKQLEVADHAEIGRDQGASDGINDGSASFTGSGRSLIPLPTSLSAALSPSDEGHDVEIGQAAVIRHAWKAVAAAGKLPDILLLPAPVHAVSRKHAAAAWKPQMHAVITGPLHGQLMLRLSREQNSGEGGGLESEVCLVQAIPNHMRIWLHSTQLKIDGQATSLPQRLTLLHLTPAANPADPFTLQLCLALASNSKSATLSWRFSKAFKHVFDHPPDAARGLDIPPVLVVTRQEVESAAAKDLWTRLAASGKPSALMWHLLTSTPDKVYSETLVTPISTPDFSMPYNVCCLTCTLLAVFFGTTLNTMMLRSRESGGRGQAQSKRSLRSRLIKMAVAMALMLGLLYRFDEGTREFVDGVFKTIGIEISSM